MSNIAWIVLWGAALTYLTRIGGHLILSRFETVHPRIEAALNVVPAAVLTTLVAPALLTAGPAEFVALVVTAIVSLRYGMLALFLAGGATLILLRQVIG
ncbi:AzlD family protein [Mesorhizobium sp. ASY16-5R]|uniref:AzlD family protein n=1 Tax=Mesorhizobium sp. ASY16-5R TaxID=3445772 RepID=UPI003FA185E8